ncbi:MAG TPA: polysaccharide deacetylase family protein [Burkholderiales bacterium]|nr:polysaccharide deacetylase family protein [Burkholderiales bacterium]
MKLALKIDVDTFRGTREGVPRLVEVLKKHNAGATFLFSLGPDRTGRAIKRVFRPGFMKKVSRTSVLEHYGLKTLLYGTLLPSPDIGLACADILRGVRDAGFEVGVHCWNHTLWQDKVGEADSEWTEKQMRLAIDRFERVFGESPRVHGAAGWQMNRYAYRLTQRLGFDYASDTRGSFPFIPMYKAEIFACPQIPGNLPTLDELIGLDGITKENVAAHILKLTADKSLDEPVFTLHAELEGMKFLPMFEQLLEGWQAQGYELVSMRHVFESLNRKKLPHHDVTEGEVDGRSGTVALQGAAFLA